jgi:multidrug efflux system membrane fusion protein
MDAGRVLRRTSPVFCIVVMVGGLCIACRNSDAGVVVASTTKSVAPFDVASDEAQAHLSLPVIAEPARDGDLVISITTTGQVRSEAASDMRFEVSGTTRGVHVRPGQLVRRGQRLVSLDPRPFDIGVRRAQAEVAQAQLRFEDVWVPDSVATGRGPSAERRQGAMRRSGLETARLDLEQRELDRERAVLIAPFDGTVDRVDVAEGERVTAGEPVVTVVDTRRLRIEAAVLQHDIPVIREGGIADVFSSAEPNVRVRGRIVAVLPLIDSVTRAGRAFVRIVGNGVLRPGMSVDVRLEAQRLRHRRLVPARAVIERDGRPLVFIVNAKQRAEWVYINPGRSNTLETEVLADSVTGEIPIKPGDLVIVQGHLTLTHDAPVRVIAQR